MRSMTRNKKPFYYASFTGKTMGKDLAGNYTEAVLTYSDPVKKEGVISEGVDVSTVQLFGISEQFDRTITLNQGEDFLSVGSVLWIDTPVSLDENGHLTRTNGNIDTPYNYLVVAVTKPLNVVNVAIRKVKAS